MSGKRDKIHSSSITFYVGYQMIHLQIILPLNCFIDPFPYVK